MSEDDRNRLIAWNHEMAAAHQRLREALHVARDAIENEDEGGPATPARELLLYCHGFCAALSGHHRGEDTGLFPELAARHPALRPTIAKLEQDHSMIEYLLTRFDHAVRSSASRAELARHLEGISAIMESHFRYEERQLLDILATLDLDAEPRTMFGPL